VCRPQLMFIRSARAVIGVALALLGVPAAGSPFTGDLILSLQYWQTDRLKTTRLANARFLADAEPRRAFHLHLDVDRDQPSAVELYEAYGEWEAGRQRWRLGRFQIPFGIHNRSELYYVGLISDPLVRYYPFQGPHLEDSANGLEYLRSAGPWQVEAVLLGRGDAIGAVVPRGDEGSLRIQRYTGSLIIGLNAFRSRAPVAGAGNTGEGHFFGLDFRFSRPALILRGEIVTGHVPGGSPEGFYLDALYHPVRLGRVTVVGRTEAVRGQPRFGGLYERETIGLKWEAAPGIAVALNQLIEPSRARSGLQGTTLYVWYTRRL
jgi:hypothetical protein